MKFLYLSRGMVSWMAEVVECLRCTGNAGFYQEKREGE